MARKLLKKRPTGTTLTNINLQNELRNLIFVAAGDMGYKTLTAYTERAIREQLKRDGYAVPKAGQ